MPTDTQPPSTDTDCELYQRVTVVLQQRGYRSHQALEFNVERGVVVVQGQVPTYYQRQVAVQCIKHIAGVTQVVDLIEVVDRPNQPQATDSRKDEQELFAVSTRSRADLLDLAGTTNVGSRPSARRRHLHSFTN